MHMYMYVHVHALCIYVCPKQNEHVVIGDSDFFF